MKSRKWHQITAGMLTVAISASLAGCAAYNTGTSGTLTSPVNAEPTAESPADTAPEAAESPAVEVTQLKPAGQTAEAPAEMAAESPAEMTAMTEPAETEAYVDTYEAEEAIAYNGAAQPWPGDPGAARAAGKGMGYEGMPAPAGPGINEFNTESYDYIAESGFNLVSSQPFSTFAADVDTASYSNFRRQILNDNGHVVPDSIRIEEMVNYFHYDYPQPEGDEPFSVTAEIAPCPWNEETQLMLVGLQAPELDVRELPDSNLVFLIDVSGSMDDPNKLPLVQRSFMTLTENLRPNDTVTLITYAAGERVILDGVPASEQQEILSSLEMLQASGSTNGEKALQTAYDLAKKHYIRGGNNRIIIATDGDFNVGVTSRSELVRMVKDRAKDGIALSVLGFGMGNYKDDMLEDLSNYGRGNYAYIDTVDEARKVLVNEAGGTLFSVAKDVKLQVEFNPETVRGWRLIGYEDRVMAAEDFDNDEKEGGEIGAGHQVTALYEIVPVESDFDLPEVYSRYGKNTQTEEDSDLVTVESCTSERPSEEYCVINIRYKDPDEDKSTRLEYPVTTDCFREDLSPNMNWAAGVAQISMLLRGSEYAGTTDAQEVIQRMKQDETLLEDDFRYEFLYLLRQCKDL
ncbi:MAG: von Willebrand factor type A domain-containing protein [Eubacterium sp.]|nr:von Willebrand factor type A domain-containing protein [Eubacterium sp.]MBQ6363161.1 von Willebrand factor type A domain-containing protein [Lachnospiraceae bacterium]